MEQNTMESGANKRRLLISISLIITLIVIVTSCISRTNDVEKLAPEEKVALDFIKSVYIHYKPQELNTILDLQNLQSSQYQGFDQTVKPGTVLIGKKVEGEGIKVVVFFEPNSAKLGNRIELLLAKKQGKWLIYQSDFRGKSSMGFDQFKQTHHYKELGIDEWKSAELSN